MHTISKLEQDALKQAAVPIVKGLRLCLKGAAGLRQEIVTSPDFWSLLHTLHTVPDIASEVFELVESIATGGTSTLTTDNYEPVISLLSDFAAAGSVGANDEQRRDLAARRGRPVQKNPTYVIRRNLDYTLRLHFDRPSPAVVRGLQAVQIIYEMTSRVPQFINQSHLDSTEGTRLNHILLLRTH